MTKRQKAKYNFEERTAPNQFRRDGKTISELYDLTIDFVCSKDETPDCVLRIFNDAYLICTICVSKTITLNKLYLELTSIEKKPLYLDTAFYVAYVILRLTGCNTQPMESLMADIRRFIVIDGSSMFVDFVRRYMGTITQPINFAKPDSDLAVSVLQLSVPSTETSKNQITEIEESFRDILDKFKAFETENELLRKELLEEKSNHQKDIESRDNKLKELQESFFKLSSQEERRRKQMMNDLAKAQIEKEAKKGPVNKVVNLDSIVEYVMGCNDADDVEVIRTMLFDMCRRNRCFDERLLQAIDKIEDRVNDLRRPIPRSITNNFGQGAAYNDIHDNTNAKIDTDNGRG